MTEREPTEAVPFWTSDASLGEIRLWDEAWTLRVMAHVGAEPYRGRAELVPLATPAGTRATVQAKAYILTPEIAVSVALAPAETPAILGTVAESRWEGMQRQVVGTAQAWYYPQDRLLVLWEAFFEERYRSRDAAQDANLRVLWTGVERFLLQQFPEAAQFVTTATDPLYDDADYQQFLTSLGYRRLSPAAFGKHVVPER